MGLARKCASVCLVGASILGSSLYALSSAGSPTSFQLVGLVGRFLGVILAWFGANVLVVGISMSLQTPGVFGKSRKTGQLPLWSRLLHAPWFACTRLMIFIKRMIFIRFSPPVPALSHIKTTNFWLGGWPDAKTTNNMPECPWDAIIDVTAEMPLEYTKVLPHHYRSYPTVDATPVSVEYLNDAAEFAISHFEKNGKSILVHCAFGIGRSSMTLCACIVATGQVKTWSEAVPILQKSRSIVKINSSMQERLNLWEEQWKKRE